MANILLEAAIRYADERKWRVLPVKGKQPLIKAWTQAASLDKPQIESWWKQWPDAEVGILTGPESGIDVVDIDPGGEESLKSLALPHTLEARTPRGGRHLFYKSSGLQTATKVLTGVDIRGKGGQVVVAPSPGREWLNDLPAAELPEIYRARFTRPNIFNIGPGVGEGGRNDTLFRYAAYLIGKGDFQWETKVYQRNLTYSPPLPDKEVALLINSAAARYKAPTPLVLDNDLDVDLVSENLPDMDWLWEDRILRGTYTIFGGAPGSGKSTLASYVAELEASQGGNVAFLQYEDYHGLVRRTKVANPDRKGKILAWRQDKLPVFPAGLPQLCEYIERRNISLLIVDSLISAVDVKYYDAQEMTAFVGPLAQFLESTGTTCILIQHMNKKEDLSAANQLDGSSAIRAKAGSAYLVCRSPESGTENLMASLKNRYGPDAQTLRFKIVGSSTGAGVAQVLGYSFYSADEALATLKANRVKAMGSTMKWGQGNGR